MLSSAFRMSVCYTPIRQFTKLITCNRNLVGKRITCCWLNRKEPNASCKAFATNRQYSTELEKKVTLPPLTDDHVNHFPTIFSMFKMQFYCIFVLPLKNINIEEFLEGANYAIKVISNALADQNYEALDQLVDEKMLSVLKEKVDSLSKAQQELVRVTDENLILALPSDIKTEVIDDEEIVEISVIIHYTDDEKLLEPNKDPPKLLEMKWVTESPRVMIGNYTFQRRTTNDTEGPWVATVVNHSSQNPNHQKIW